MLRIRNRWIFTLVFIVTLIFCCPSPVQADPVRPILGFDWSFHADNGSDRDSANLEPIQESDNVNFAYELSKRLNTDRDEIGRNLFSIVHPNAVYDYTEPILMAEKPGNRAIFEIPIHWHRDLKLFQRNHLTRIRWQIGDRHHLNAEVIYDDSTFDAIRINEMNDSLRLLLNQFD